MYASLALLASELLLLISSRISIRRQQGRAQQSSLEAASLALSPAPSERLRWRGAAIAEALAAHAKREEGER